MGNKNNTGIYQLDNGCWAYRYKINIDGTAKEKRRRTDELGNPFKTKSAAAKARQQAIVNEKVNAAAPQAKRLKKTFIISKNLLPYLRPSVFAQLSKPGTV